MTRYHFICFTVSIVGALLSLLIHDYLWKDWLPPYCISALTLMVMNCIDANAKVEKIKKDGC